MYFLSTIHRDYMDLSSQMYNPMNKFANNQKKQPSMPSMKNMYASDYWDVVRKDELSRGTVKTQQSRNPLETGIVPRPAYANMFESIEPVDYNANSFISLSGEVMNKESFKHMNMVPFIKGSVRQNMDPRANETLLQNYTGRSDLIQHKKEVECFFEPTPDNGNVCGMPDNTEFNISRVVLPTLRNNESPIDKIYVGPGLAAGFTSEPTGGFAQNSTLDYARPRNVDELRTLTNPKLSYELPMQGPKGGISQRGFLGKFNKNKPEGWYEQSPDMWLKTSGANYKDRNRPVQPMKPTSRVDTHIEYEGIAAATDYQPGNADKDDFNVGSHYVYDNERQTTQEPSVLTNLKNTVNAVISPLLDIFRPTRSEYTIDSKREYGMMHVQVPSKATIYDPVNHIMRTTIKETLIHDTTLNNLTGPERNTAALMDDAKKTVRQTLPLQESTVNLAAPSKIQIYNADQVRKTIRNTIACTTNELGFMDASDGIGAYNIYDAPTIDLRQTQKQYTSDVEYKGISKSMEDFRPMSEEMYDNSQISINKEEIIMHSDYTPNGAGDFTSLDPDRIDMEIKKLDRDYMTQRENNNITHVDTVIKPIECEAVTKQSIRLLAENDGRLDSSVLSSLKSNPYSMSINPIR
jgi:hypothetical protein